MRSPTNIILACIAAFDMSSLIIQAPWYDIFLLDEEIVFCSFQAFLHLQPGPPLSAPGDQGGVLHHGAMCGYHSLHVPHNSKLAYTGALRYGWRVTSNNTNLSSIQNRPYLIQLRGTFISASPTWPSIGALWRRLWWGWVLPCCSPLPMWSPGLWTEHTLCGAVVR